jgi:hypothetical protein
MLATATVTASVGHPAVAALLGLGASGLAGAVVAMAWNVHIRQIRLAELLVRRQISVTAEATAETPAEPAAPAAVNGGHGNAAVPEARGASRTRPPQLTIDGPDTVVAGEQVRYTVRPSGNGKVVTWAAGGGSVSQAPDPAHPDQLLLIADRPGNLMITARVREGLTERRETKSVTAVPDGADLPSPAVPRLFLHSWGAGRGRRGHRRIRRSPRGPGQPRLLRLHRPSRAARRLARRARAGHRQDRRRRERPRSSGRADPVTYPAHV